MAQLNGPAVNCDTDAQRATVVAPFPIGFKLMTNSAKRLEVVRMALKVTITMRAPNVINLRCGLDDAA
jgi:hypothetical protein